MRLLHYSLSPLGELRDRNLELSISDKPYGLWVSVEGEDDWPSWCRSENFRIEALATVSEIVLSEDDNLLRLASAQEIDWFTKEYRHPPPFSLPFPSTRYIDWPAVARRYDGIIIAPYIWERGLHGGADWYYGWDCASGCIWRPSKAIASITVVDREAVDAL